MQWADRGSLELIRYLAPAIRDRAILVVGTYRGEEAEPAADPPRPSGLIEMTEELFRERLAERLEVAPLDRRATAELVGAIFGLDRPASADFGAAIHRHTGGNPFFIEEVVKALVESGAIFEEDGTILRRELHDLAMPPAVRDLVAARLARLGRDGRRILEVLAVASRACSIGVLARAAGLAPERAARAAGEAYRRQFLSMAAGGGYCFRHELVRRALLDHLLPDEQASLHGRLAGAIEAEYAADLAAWQAELAEHYARAGKPGRAAGHAWPAARLAIATHAYETAISLLRICLAGEAAAPEAAEVLELLGDAHAWVGDLVEAEQLYRQSLSEPASPNDPARGGRLLAKLAQLTSARGDAGRALELCEDAVAELATIGDQRQLALAYAGLSRFRWLVGDLAGALASAELATRAGEASGDTGAFAAGADQLAFQLTHTGQTDRAEKVAQRCYARAAGAGDLSAMQHACKLLGTIYGDIRADYRRARHYYRQSLALARRCGRVSGEIKALHNLGAWVCKPLGQWRRAELLLLRAYQLAERIDHRHAALYSLVHLAELAVLRGDWPLARERLASTSGLALRDPDVMVRCRLAATVEAPLLIHDRQPAVALSRLQAVWREACEAAFAGGQVVVAPPLADLLLELGRVDDAEAILARAASLWPSVQDAAGEIEGQRVLARLHRARGDDDRAIELLGLAGNRAEALDRPYDLARIRRDRAVLVAARDPATARDLFRRALVALVELGAAAEAARLVALGDTNRAIGTRLSLTEGTVEVHIRHIFNKLGLERRAQLATWVTSRR